MRIVKALSFAILSTIASMFIIYSIADTDIAPVESVQLVEVSVTPESPIWQGPSISPPQSDFINCLAYCGMEDRQFCNDGYCFTCNVSYCNNLVDNTCKHVIGGINSCDY